MNSHGCHPPPNVHLPLHLQILKRRLPEPALPKRSCASGDRARRRTMTEDAVHARLAHLVVTFRVHEELHVRVEVARRFAYWADV